MKLKWLEVFIILMLISTLCYGETIKWMGYNCDKDWSWKDFTGRKFLETNITEGTVICGSCFSQEEPDSVVFPDDMTGAIFINNNLDNCYIPLGNIVIEGSQRRFKVMTDRNDWVVDEKNKPLEPIDKEKYLELGISIKPEDLPMEEMSENIIEKKMKELNVVSP